MTTPLTGLLLGAGASYEVGIQLVWDITAELKNWLTPEHIRSLNDGWRKQRGGYPDRVIDDFVLALSTPELHYEAVLGHLETQYRRNTADRDHYHGLYSWLVQMVYAVLHIRHTNHVEYIERQLHHLDGIAKLADQNTPLWVFSLNHDVIIECLAAVHGLTLNSGFTDGSVTFPRRNKDGDTIGEIHGTVLSGARLEKSALEFPQAGSGGINLLKIHGALDIFTFRNGEDVVKLCPTENTVRGVIEMLRIANEELFYADPNSPDGKIHASNEIAYADQAGEMQFLRRTLLAGAFKFDDRGTQVLPKRFLQLFKSHLNWVKRLLSVGYSFGDTHINQVIREWLEHSGDRRLEVVDPFAPKYPGSMLHLAPQIKLVKAKATDYFDAEAGIERTRLDTLEKRIAAWQRERKDKGKSAEAFATFIREYQKEHIFPLIAKALEELPKTKDGDWDMTGVADPDAYARSMFERWGLNAEAMYDAFLTWVAQHPEA